MKHALVICMAFLSVSSYAQQNTLGTNETATNQNMGITYTYYDGNNNEYVIQPGLLEYKPVQPAESSSGVYSGGVPAPGRY